MKPKVTKLTDAQRKALEAIRAHVKEHGLAPTRSELKDALELHNQVTVDSRLHGLAKKGWIELVPFVERGIRLLREGIPVLEQEDLPVVRAGPPIVAEQFAEAPRVPEFNPDATPFRAKPDLYLRARGDSMNQMGVSDGSLIALQYNPKPNEGDMVVARIGDEITLKRYRRRNENLIELEPVSSNVGHEPIRIDAHTVDFEIIGSVVGVLSGVAS